MIRRARPTPGLMAVLAVAVIGCAESGDGSADSAVRDSTAAVPFDSIASAETEPFDPNPLPLLPGEGEPRDYQLLLVNRLERDAYVYASAGAARVALDTVPKSDSVFVDIRLRADFVDLEAQDGSGAVLDSTSIDLVGTQINRWEITARPGARVTFRESTGPLVTSKPGDYPRSQ